MRLSHPSQADGEPVIDVQPSFTVNVTRLSQLAKAAAPMLVTLAGRVISLMAVLWNALYLIVAKFSGSRMFANEVHPLKALPPICVTVAGIVTWVNDVQFWHTSSGIAVKVVGKSIRVILAQP